jgi:hypothetical protein
VYINFDLDTNPLEIKTDSTIGSGDLVYVQFRNSQGEEAGGLTIKFTSPPTHFIDACRKWTNFPTDLPTARNKVWRITKSRISGIRLIVHCNEREVLNVSLSDSTSHYSTYDK